MNKYDTYLAKMQKINAVRTFAIKYKVPLLAALIISSTAFVGFLSTKGMIISSFDVPNTITYGEEYKIKKANVLFGSASYEFKEKNSDTWTKESPSYPGSYYIRTVTTRSFGIKNYSKEKLFEIKPLNVKYEFGELTTLTYGDLPSFNDSFLVGNDKIEKINISFEDASLEETTASIDSITIKNEEGKDVSSFYTFDIEDFKVKLLPRNVSYLPLIESKTYDGEEILYEGKIKQEIKLYDDIISFDVYYTDLEGNILSSTPKNAGEYYINVDIDSFKAMNNGVNVTNKYNIINSKSPFSINKRNITIDTMSCSKEYDGIKSFDETNSVELSKDSQYELVNGDTYQICEDINYQNITDAGTLKNILEVKIFNKDSEDVTANYSIKYVYGDLEIQKRYLEVIPNSFDDFMYDGSIVSYDSLEHTNYESILDNKTMVDGQLLLIYIKFKNSKGVISSEVSDADTYTLTLLKDDFEIINGNKDNYDIRIVSSITFTITPRNITIKPINLEDTQYDGNIHDYLLETNNFEVTSDSLGLVDDDAFIVNVIFEGKLGSYKNYYKDADNYKYYISDITPIGETKKSNYNFTYQEESVIVSPIAFTISLNDIENKVYDGEIYQYDTYSYQCNFIDGEGVSLVLKYYKQIDDKYVESEPLDSGVYKVAIDSLICFDNTNLTNYSITYGDAEMFEITKRNVTLSLNSFSSIYGEVFTFDKANFSITDGNFVKEQRITLDIDTENIGRYNVGSYQLISKGINYFNGAKEENYQITIINDSSYLTILERSITIISKEITDFVYDGKDHTYEDLVGLYYSNFDYASESQYNLVSGEEIYLDAKFFSTIDGNTYDSIKNAQEYYVRLDKESIIGNELFDIKNYHITIVDRLLTIGLRHIVISPIDIPDKEYDGEYVTYDSSKNKIIIENPGEYTLVEGDTATINVSFYIDNYYNPYDKVKDANVYQAIITGISIKDKDENDVKFNYSIDYQYTEFEIFKRDVTLKYRDDQKVYDGENYVFDMTNYDVVESNFIEDEKGVNLSLYSYYDENNIPLTNIKNTGRYSLIVEPLEGINGVDLNNYNILFDNSTIIEIKKRSVTLQTLDITDFEYDGQEHYYDSDYGNYQVVSETKMVGEEAFILPVSFIYENKSQSYALNAGYYKMEVSSMEDTYINGINGFLYSNYDLTIIFGEFNINKRHVEVKLEDISKVYDGQTYNHTYNIITINGTSFPNDEGIEAQKVLFSKDPLDVGVYEMELNSFTYKENTLEKNYDIDHSTLSTLEITKRQVTIMPINFENKEYDGAYYQYDNSSKGNYVVTSDISIVEGEVFIINSYFMMDNDETRYSEVKDAARYYLYIDGVLTSSGNENTKLTNYEITYGFTEFEISPLALTIEPDLSLIEGELYYDGNEKDYIAKLNNFIVTNNKNMVEGEGFIASINIFDEKGDLSSLIHAGYYSLSINVSTLIPNENTKLSNYALSTNFVDYSINPRKLIINLLDMEDVTYDGLPHSYYNGVENNYILIEGSMVGEEILAVYCNVGNEIEAYDAGIYGVKYSQHEVIGGIAADYEIEQKTVNIFQILRRNVSISLYQIDDLVYSGKTVEPYNLLQANQFTYQEGSDQLVEGEKIYFKKIAYFDYITNEKVNPRNAGTYSYTIYLEDEYIIFEGRKLANYSIQFDRKTFEINKADLNVKLFEDDIVHTYNNEEVTDIYGFNSNILGQDKISISVKVFNDNKEEETPINAKTYYIYIDQVIVSCPSNYNIIISDSYRRIIINPCDVYVSTSDKEVTYNGEKVDLLNEMLSAGPTNGSTLYNGDEIIIVGFNYYSDSLGTNIISNPKDAGQYYFGIDEVTINNIEHINNYNFICDGGIYSLIINPKKVIIYPLQMQTIDYDGKEHSYPTFMGNYDYAIGALNGVEFNISIVFRHYGNKNNNSNGALPDEIEDVRSTYVSRAYLYLYDGIIVNECNGDLISNYSYQIGSDENIHKNRFKIRQLKITVYTGGGSSIYDGEYHLFDENITSTGELIEGHELVVCQSINKQDYMFKDVGEYDNKFPVDIFDMNNLDNEYNGLVTENYNITYVNEKVTIFQREITIESLERVINYSGTLVEKSNLKEGTEYLISNLASNDSIKVSTNYRENKVNEFDYIDAGNYINYIIAKITDKEGNNVTKNYKINYIYNQLSIVPLDLTVEFKNVSTYFSNTSFDYSFNNPEIYVLSNDKTLKNADILTGDFTFILNEEVVDQIKTVGNYEVLINYISVIDSETGRDKTHCYNISNINNNLNVEIKPIEVIVYTNSYSWAYDGKEHSYLSGYYGMTDNEVDYFFSIDFYGEAPYVKDVGEEKINEIPYRFVTYDGDDISYAISVTEESFGTIRISDNLSIDNCIQSHTFDGKVHDETSYRVNGLIDGINQDNLYVDFEIEYKDNILPYDAGSYYCRIVSYKVIFIDDEGNEIDQTDYYVNFNPLEDSRNLNFEEYYYYVHKKSVYIGLKNEKKKKVYDGTPLLFESDEWYYIRYGDTFDSNEQFAFTAGIVNSKGVVQPTKYTVGTYTYQIVDYTICNEYGLEMTLNDSSTGLIDKYLSYTIYVREQDDPLFDSKNMHYTCKGTISQRTLNVKTYGNEEEIIYDGQKHYVNRWEMDVNGEGQGLIEDDSIALKENSFYAINAGKTLNRLLFSITNIDGTNVSSSYKIVYNRWEEGYINISKRKLVIQTGSKTVTTTELVNNYGGTLTCLDYTIIEGELVDGESLFNEELYNLFTDTEKYNYRNSIAPFIIGSLSVVGNVENSVNTSKLYAYKLDKNGKLTPNKSKNYEFTIIYGTLTVVFDGITIL